MKFVQYKSHQICMYYCYKTAYFPYDMQVWGVQWIYHICPCADTCTCACVCVCVDDSTSAKSVGVNCFDPNVSGSWHVSNIRIRVLHILMGWYVCVHTHTNSKIHVHISCVFDLILRAQVQLPSVLPAHVYLPFLLQISELLMCTVIVCQCH